MKKYCLLVLIVLLGISLFTGCSWGKSDNNVKTPDTPNNPSTPNTPETPNTPNTPETPATKTVTIYYVNVEYALTGNEDLKSVLPVERQITIGNKAIEELIVEELQKKPIEQGLATELERLTILNVYTEGDTAFVNFSEQNLNGGSLQESLALSQLVSSLTALEAINQVQILVNGNVTETFMGHISIEEPLRNE
ncbi:hypothetical protein BHU72_01015 [Desulfuribacillus stibiiarsenatis]|uniref:GerMN domain-containing protein n=1 Tax=Desulfuribacillus stibiiarsenatis TaxID=1390249 RepID=A0A1E5L9Q0_9FIRM|nr:GerMN domain-containing protein [Desulfuribacillus stibiiarsenatis]OEH86875.1 hypothetical protein BHU72_01015 [Desulfuribacillus stibiiarsenatis]